MAVIPKLKPLIKSNNILGITPNVRSLGSNINFEA
jgi:hypothetical protein